VKTLAPGKPIRYVVNSHGHFDHSGGVRAAVAEGATVVTGAANVPYFERALAVPNGVRPDRLAQSGKTAKFVAVGDRLSMADSMRVIEFHAIAGSAHAESFLMVYLPEERILIEADAFTPGAPNTPPPATPNPNNLNLIANIERLGFPVDRIVPLHGRVVPLAELYAAVGKTSPR
jgi:glyoxylase-like metal-dependent hydrolase (beta-lactamase superfamily II)